ncbi:AraC family transcriptional regulator [Halobacteriovorax marinus]|uniref:AraC family transcriptional regulator n=1 Tax=Halobacteriovorax marinus TaxID=97084 RepID=A0A1Y5FD59_9BACT|nr:AraC family transcriptional regulator [Halobacteriovorax marinus]
MNNLIKTVKESSKQTTPLPFSVYSSVKEQHIFNVPIIRPLLVFVLSGVKRLGKQSEVIAPAGSFVFLSNSSSLDMRNIPNDEEYLALLIEFDYSDFNNIQNKSVKPRNTLQGDITLDLEKTITQFIEWSYFAPPEMWSLRKQEILQFMYYSGVENINSVAEAPSFGHEINSIISNDLSKDIGLDVLCSNLGVSESTLRRKLKSEGTSLQEIKDQARLGLGLHLIQTTLEPIGIIAGLCGYQSQSRFTDKFKQLFNITPSELRKTRMTD